MLKVKKVFYGQKPPSGESTTTECWVNYQLLAVITEVAQRGIPSCSRPQQLRTMASETVDPIHWSHPTPSWPVPPELHVLHGVNATCKSLDLVHQPGLERASTGMPEQRTTGAATQGITYVLMKQSYCTDFQHCLFNF